MPISAERSTFTLLAIGWRLAVAVAWCGCETRTLDIASDPRDAMLDTAQGDAAATPAQCDDHTCACDDGVDNDQDMQVDGFDSECSGPLDDDETSFGLGVPAGTEDCRACFFMRAAASPTTCAIPHECVLNGAAMPMPPTEFQCAQDCELPMSCMQDCRPLTPNGCDCFGCCTIERAMLPALNVLLTDRCSLASLDDESACPRCVPTDGCRNPCGRCELCPGRSLAELPPDCERGGVGYKCDERERVCDSDNPCPGGAYCHFGCCLEAMPMMAMP